MIGSRKLQSLAMGFAVGAALLLAPTLAYAHCDTMDGPVVKAAQAALASRELAPVLIWIPAKDDRRLPDTMLLRASRKIAIDRSVVIPA